VPLQWALAQHNLANALESLGERESGTVRLEEAVAAYRQALMERTRARVPLDWAESFGRQGVALIQLARRTKDTTMAETACKQIEAALKFMRAAGRASYVVYYESRLADARRARDALAIGVRRDNRVGRPIHGSVVHFH